MKRNFPDYIAIIREVELYYQPKCEYADYAAMGQGEK
jgi:hypothetical protein